MERIAFEKNNINEFSDMVPLDRIGAIKAFKKAGFIHTDKEIIEKIFYKDTIVKQLLITKDMYFDIKGDDNNEWNNLKKKDEYKYICCIAVKAWKCWL